MSNWRSSLARAIARAMCIFRGHKFQVIMDTEQFLASKEDIVIKKRDLAKAHILCEKCKAGLDGAIIFLNRFLFDYTECRCRIEVRKGVFRQVYNCAHHGDILPQPTVVIR